MEFETVIGLEVHAQLQTRSKMFCCCSADYASAPPNTHVCPVCLGMPGVLPVINQEAVRYAVMTALALNCTVSGYSKFDRKSYPYPDLMKGYQISQYDAPIGHDGWMTIDVEGQTRQVGITRVHLEEDTARLTHRSGLDGEHYSLVDVNRSGVPLMEIVGEPDLRSPEEARQYLVKLRSILRYLGVSTANMEEGSFRCDANISIRPDGSRETTPKVEVKNMNSFRAVYHALEYEATRQRRAFARGEELFQETRGWVDETGKTVTQRGKEYADDYRYFPEPDLPPLVFNAEWVESIKAELPELPEARRSRFVAEYGLPEYDAGLLTNNRDMADYFEACLKTGLPAGLPLDRRAKLISNWLLGEVNRILNAHSIDVQAFQERVPARNLAALLVMERGGTTSAATTKVALEQMFATSNTAQVVVDGQRLGQITDAGEIEEAVSQAINSNQQAVSDYRAGKDTALKFLVGQVMKATRGRANPQVAGELLKKKLGEE